MRIFIGDNEAAAVLAAVEDLQTDLRDVTGAVLPVASYHGYAAHPGFVVCTLNRGDDPLVREKYAVDTGFLAGKRESFVIRKCGDTVVIIGSDMLGTVFGVYHAAEHFVGIDPLRFWTEISPAKKSLAEVLRRADAPVDFGPPAIPLRGWFVNDYDLIRQWDYGGRRWACDVGDLAGVKLRSPHLIGNPATYDGLIGTLLRLKQNLLVAGTYVCPRNTLWREVMQMAARRGLYNTTQHFQPLGCWPVSFDRYWEQKGRPQKYSWLENREVLLETWDAFAQSMASLRPVWQVGYRGRDDAPFWTSEEGTSESLAERGTVISEAIAAQVEIAKKYDPEAICTYFLWAEGDPLYRSGHLKLPDDVIVVYSDYGRTSIMKQAFWQHEPGSRKASGIYYHLSYWPGATNHMGVAPEKIDFNLRHACAKSTTNYLLVNVGNVREHLLGGCAVAEISVNGIDAFTPESAIENWCRDRWGAADGARAAKLYREFFKHLPATPAPHRLEDFPKLLNDGCLQLLIAAILDLMMKGEVSDAGYLNPATTKLLRRANLPGIMDEGDELDRDAFTEDDPDEMLFPQLDDFLDFAAATAQRLTDDMAGMQRQVDELAAAMSGEGSGRFLRSDLGAQAAMLSMVAGMLRNVAHAAKALAQSQRAEAKRFLQQALDDTEAGFTNWFDKYEGRFEQWPGRVLCVDLEAKLDQIRQILNDTG